MNPGLITATPSGVVMRFKVVLRSYQTLLSKYRILDREEPLINVRNERLVFQGGAHVTLLLLTGWEFHGRRGQVLVWKEAE